MIISKETDIILMEDKYILTIPHSEMVMVSLTKAERFLIDIFSNPNRISDILLGLTMLARRIEEHDLTNR